MHERIDRHPADTSVAASPSLSLWEAVTRQAMQAEDGVHIAAAFAAYERALDIARQLIESPVTGRGDDRIAALVVSHHNLADLHARQGHHDDAARFLCHAHHALIALSVDAERPAALRATALHHSRETHVALIRHVARYGPHPLIARTIDEATLALSASGAARH